MMALYMHVYQVDDVDSNNELLGNSIMMKLKGEELLIVASELVWTALLSISKNGAIGSLKLCWYVLPLPSLVHMLCGIEYSRSCCMSRP
jgi:hypothetical protein